LWFKPAPGDRGTEVKVVIEYAPPGGVVASAVAKLFGEEPQQQIGDELRRFYADEAGEIDNRSTKGELKVGQRQTRRADLHFILLIKIQNQYESCLLVRR